MLVDKIHIHPDWRYHTENYDADIAILKFLNGITFSEYIFPICWPSRAENEKKFRGTVVGWGKSENKEKLNEDLPKELQVESVINEVCFLGDYKFAIISSNRTFCAGVMNAGPCFGDSGKTFTFDCHSVAQFYSNGSIIAVLTLCIMCLLSYTFHSY